MRVLLKSHALSSPARNTANFMAFSQDSRIKTQDPREFLLSGFAAIFFALLLGPTVAAEIPTRVAVNLPVTATIEGVTLEPAAYTMVIDNFDGRSATIKIMSHDGSKLRVTVPVRAVAGSERARHNAVKVITRDGTYLLDKLLLAGETTYLQFRN